MLYVIYFFKKCILLKIPSHNTIKIQKHIPLCALLSNNPNFHFTGKWYFEDCGKEGYGYICEKMQGKQYLLFLFLPFPWPALLFHVCFTCCVTGSPIADSARHRFFELYTCSHLISTAPGLCPPVGF